MLLKISANQYRFFSRSRQIVYPNQLGIRHCNSIEDSNSTLSGNHLRYQPSPEPKSRSSRPCDGACPSLSYDVWLLA
ncbi:hypothetical protein WG66_001213, partial [Moniliophthora roreri]